MAHAVSCRPLTEEAQVSARDSPCGICDRWSGNGTRFSPSFSVFLCRYHSVIALHYHISPGGWTIGLLVAAVQRHSPNEHEKEQVQEQRYIGGWLGMTNWEECGWERSWNILKQATRHSTRGNEKRLRKLSVCTAEIRTQNVPELFKAE
jgi:hypothetical protein